MVLILELKTTQTAAIKILSDTLNSLLTDVNFVFYPNFIENDSDDSEEEPATKQVGGIIIKEINKTGTILVYTKLDADKFDYYNYNYNKNKFSVGLNLNNLLKCLKCMSHFDTMIWQVDSDDMNKLVIILESSERKEKKIFKLNLMDLEEEKYEVEPIDFPFSITLPSQDFHKYCKDMSSATDKIELMCTKNKIIFSGNGELGHVEFEVGETNGGLSIDVNSNCSDEIVQGLFELRFLIIFTKCTNLCSTVTLYLKNDYPLIVKYSIAMLGEIKLVLSPSKPS
uniref:Proliferating cell nuclear antigen PCNA N-terminal domain-containing protein n=1 Tax=viral metagenome TaxID=1070528 RepID=A0A6C0D817_9ZZZZ